MVAYNKFNDFVEQLCKSVHNFDAAGHVMKCFLTNELPLAADTIKTDMAEIAGGNGYTTGGEDAQNTVSEAAGTATVQGTKITWTATGAIPTFQYVVLYNDDATVPLDALVCWWDYGSGVTMGSGDSFAVKFNNSDTQGDIFTIA
jgi:hypothetical protein